jgi:predicted Zn-dependent protease
MRNSAKKSIKFIIFVLLIFFLDGCVTIYNPATERRETLFFDTQSEVALGVDIDKQIQKKLKILHDPQLQQRLDSIGIKVATYSDRQDLSYHFRIVNDKELNAFAIPGGFVYVNSGLITAANDAELAGVLAHEIGHIAARHSVKKLQAAMGYQIITNIVLGRSGQAATEQALDIVFNLVNLGYSRQDEFLADKLAVRYTRRANFSPLGIITFFAKLKAEAEKKGTGIRLVFLSSHPPIEKRIARVENEIRLYPY